MKSNNGNNGFDAKEYFIGSYDIKPKRIFGVLRNLDMIYISILIFIALIGNLFMRRWISKVDQQPNTPETYVLSQGNLESIKPGEVLKAWGQLSEEADLWHDEGLHPEINRYLQAYQFIGPDEYLPVLDRRLARKPFERNNSFVQIGAWVDGSEILVRRDDQDTNVYIASIENGDPNAPERMADSFEMYLRIAWEYFQDSIK